MKGDAPLDALLDLCNIGMANAASALGRLTEKVVRIESTSQLRLSDEELQEFRYPAIGVQLQIFGKLGGKILLLVREDHARLILQLLLGSPCEASFSEMEESALKEVGNIMASACLNSLGVMLKMSLLPEVPTLVQGEAAEVLAAAVPIEAGGAGVAMATRFCIADPVCGGTLFLIPDPAFTAVGGGTAQ